jgi:hypothetical protein
MPRFIEEVANYFLDRTYADIICTNAGLSKTYGISIFVRLLAPWVPPQTTVERGVTP